MLLKIHKGCMAAIALLLVVCMLPFEPLRVLAESTPVYISEIKMKSSSSAEEAKKWLTDNGYKVVDKNLNQNNDGDSVYMGYKTTGDKTQAITDVRMMNMNGGFQVIDFNKRLEDSLTDELYTRAEKIKEGFAEFKENLQKNESGERVSPMAVLANDVLHEFTVLDRPLDEYLMDPNVSVEEFEKVFSVVSADTSNMINYLLAMGVSDASGVSFAEKIRTARFFDLSADKDDIAGIDAEFDADAGQILDAVKQFAENYKVAKKHAASDDEYIKKNFDNDDEEPKEVNVKELANNKTDRDANVVIVDENLTEDNSFTDIADVTNQANLPNITVAKSYDDAEKYQPEEATVSTHIIYRGVYGKLASYPITSKVANNFGDYLLAVAEETNTKTAKRMLYPFVSILTSGQLYNIKYAGLLTYVENLDINTQENADKTRAELNKENDRKKYSIFSDIDTDLYTSTVAYTDAAVRKEATGKVKGNQLNDNDSVLKNYRLSLVGKMVKLAYAAGGLLLGFVGFQIAFKASVTTMVKLLVFSVEMAVKYGVMTACQVGAIVGCSIGIAAIAVVVAIVVVLIIYLIVKYVKEKKEEKKVEYTKIPDIIYDVEGENYLKYKVVSDGGGVGCGIDVNSHTALEWDAMYVSYDTNAGSPLREIDGVGFVVKNSNAAVDSMMPVWRFGDQVLGANLKRFTRNDIEGIYLNFYSENSLNGVSGGRAIKHGKYISDLKLVTESTRLGAISKLEAGEFSVIDINLSPNYSDKYTYLGYKTTTNVDSAVTDIRVGFNINVNINNYSFGQSNYACAGTTPMAASIFYSISPYAGTPILAENGIIGVMNRSDAPSGFEPVNLFTGGDAFDFRMGNGQTDNFDTHAYLYFKPTVTYTSGTEYLGGLAFIYYDHLNNTVSKEDYVKAIGFEQIANVKDVNIFQQDSQIAKKSGCDSITVQTKNDTLRYSVHIVYSKTYNPYRAIADISLYKSSVASKAVYSSISIGTGQKVQGRNISNAYSATNAFVQGNEFRSIKPTAAYISNFKQDGGSDYDPICHDYVSYGYRNPESAATGGINWALYVTGASTLEPLKLDEFEVRTDNNEPKDENWSGVHELGDSFERKASNLCCNTTVYDRNGLMPEDNSVVESTPNECYLFIKRKVPEKPDYVESIVVKTATDKDNKMSADMAFLSLLPYGLGKIEQCNLSVDENNQSIKTESNGRVVRNSNYSETTTYMKIIYTNNNSSVLRDIIMVDAAVADAAKDKLTYRVPVMNNKTGKPATSRFSKRSTVLYNEYKRAGDVIKSSGDRKDYYLYYSTTTTAGYEIEDIEIDRMPLKAGTITPFYYNDAENLTKDNAKYGFDGYFYHMRRSPKDTDPEYAATLCYFSTNSQKDTYANLANINTFNCVLDYNFETDVNDGAYNYVGYRVTKFKDYDDIITGLTVFNDGAFSPSKYNNFATYVPQNGTSATVYYWIGCYFTDNSKEYFFNLGYTRDKSVSAGVDFSTLRVVEGTYAPDTTAGIIKYKDKILGVADGSIQLADSADQAYISELANIFTRGASKYSNWICAVRYHLTRLDDGRLLPLEGPFLDIERINDSKTVRSIWYQTVNSKDFDAATEEKVESIFKSNGLEASIFGDGNVAFAVSAAALLILAAVLCYVKRKKIADIISKKK